MNHGFSVNYGKSFLKIFAMSSKRNSTLHVYVKSVLIVQADTTNAQKIFFYRFLSSMTPSNTALYIIELSYLQYLMSTDVKVPAPLLTIEKSTSYMDVQR